MKKIFLTLALAALSLGIKAQSIIDVVTYHLVEGTTFYYSHDFPELANINFNLPIADDLSISGTHIQFSLDYDTFVWHLVRKSGMSLSDVTSNPRDQYYDFYITEFLDNGCPGFNGPYDSFEGSCRTYIIRVCFYR